MAATSAGRSSCGSEQSNPAHPVGPGPPGACKADFRRAGKPRESGWLHSVTRAPPCKSNHLDLLPRLDAELCRVTLKLSLKWWLVTVKANACRVK